MAKLGAILTLVLSIVSFVGCGLAVSYEMTRVATGAGVLGFVLFFISVFMFLRKKQSTNQGAPPQKKKK